MRALSPAAQARAARRLTREPLRVMKQEQAEQDAVRQGGEAARIAWRRSGQRGGVLRGRAGIAGPSAQASAAGTSRLGSSCSIQASRPGSMQP